MRIFEDEATDQQARDAAVSVYDGLVKWLPGNLQALKPAEDFHFDLEAYPGSLILPFEDQKLVIVFEPSGGKPNVGDENGWIGIFLPFLRTPGDPTGVDRMLAANKIEFVHEYIHFLLKRREEMSRERSQQKHQRSDGQFPEDGKPAYYNHPQETNAYYQEAAIRMADRIKALHPDDRAKLARDKTDDLVRWAYQFFSRPFLKNLTDDNKRKLVKRLARYVEQSLRPALKAI